MRYANATLFVVGLAAVPLSPAKAQYCSSFPLSWPFCVAGAAINAVTAVAAAPFYATAGRPYYYGTPHYYRRSRSRHVAGYHHHNYDKRYNYKTATLDAIRRPPSGEDDPTNKQTPNAGPAPAPKFDATTIEPPPRLP